MQNEKVKYYQLIPEKIYQDLITIEDYIRPKIKGYLADNMKEVISIIACNIHKNDNYTSLKMIYIKKLVPQGDKYLMALIDLGIIKRSGYYTPRVASYKYNFAPEYESKYLRFPLNSAKLIRRIETAQKEFRNEAAKSVRRHSEQTKYLRRLLIDPEYEKFIESNYIQEMDQYNCILSSATKIINGDIFFSIDSTSGRFHSNVTNMAKELRPFLRINNEPLINIDIKNSQPYLSTIILTNPSKVSWLTENPAFSMLLQDLKISLNEDVKYYISLVIYGNIYEYLMSEFAKERLELTRDETKRQVLRILFARNRMPKDEINRKCRQIFKDRFPTVHRIFSKVRGHEKGNKFQNYKRFSILLQRIESYLMLEVILKRIYRELPGTIAITIHDSIMTGILTNNVDAVKRIMIEELTFFIGFQPQIKIERELKKIKREEITTKQYDTTTFVMN